MDKFTILMVDDISDNLFSLGLLLEDSFEDLEIFEATTVDDALEIVKENNIDLILSDIQMPEAGGFDLAKSLLDIEKGKEIPIIMITGVYDDDLYRKLAYKSSKNVVDYIVKPIDDEIFNSKLSIYKEIFENRKKDKLKLEEKDKLLKEEQEMNTFLENVNIDDSDLENLEKELEEAMNKK